MAYIKLEKCKYCEYSFEGVNTSQRANHSRWCEHNPKKLENGIIARDRARANMLARPNPMHDPVNKKKISVAVKEAHERGAYLNRDYSNYGSPHTESAKEKIRKGALLSGHRRLVRSIRPYVKQDGTVVMLDSSWEELLAKRLDFLDVRWVRPLPIKWIDKKNAVRNYFPDFYLPDYDLYLDPKNPMAMVQQQEKVDWLKANVKNLIFLHNLKEIEIYTPIA